MSVVSLNLAIVNLLPIPILDGGAILTLLIETVMGRDLSLNVKEAMFKVGFVFLMMLMVFVIYNDIARRFTPGLLINAGATCFKNVEPERVLFTSGNLTQAHGVFVCPTDGRPWNIEAVCRSDIHFDRVSGPISLPPE